MRHGKSVGKIETMEIVKQKAIELLLDIVSKEEFEELLYEKVCTEDLLKNKLLFDIITINYRIDTYKKDLLNVIEKFISEEGLIIYKINLYSSKIVDSENNKLSIAYFEKMYTSLFDFGSDYGLMWDFYSVQERIYLIDLKYEKEEKVVKDLKTLCIKVCNEFKTLLTIEEKIKLLLDGFSEEVIEFREENVSTVNELIVKKKWFQFWK
jgi:hypothetical protein